MIYQSEKITYHPVMTVLQGGANDILICRDAGSDRDSFYTLLVIKDHEVVKKLIRILETSTYGYACCLDFFQYQNQYCIAFPHVKERSLQGFYMASQFSARSCMEICENLVLQCMLSKLPYPLLYLVLEQEQVHLLKDYNIELGYTLELSGLDESIGEKECAEKCAYLTRKLLQEKNSKRNIGYHLLSKKIPREDYQSIQELYRDLKISRKAGTRMSALQWVKYWWQENRNRLFRLLLITCLVLLFFVVACFLSKAIWGDVLFLRVFYNHFKVIGTESLVS